ncbi:Alpha/beta hydrolase domain-containing protein 17A [Symbiodinium microadriaticum]|uniref:Alpha/beta hydrolase domain-containing protein 17A n=1 Tax=Symbiodinium microadriaticum TaxID=2951 RepID=A0A1Q9CR29_SYMMI|nr:Alpha/beta hydrolase domain-containing protein 17A [Symbiodinium microadriaticum]
MWYFKTPCSKHQAVLSRCPTNRLAVAMGSAINAVAFPAPHLGKAFYQDELLRRRDLVFLKTDQDESIPACHVRAQRKHSFLSTPPVTILYSHGNAEDVGLHLDYIDALAEYTGADVFSYEYVGYSLSRLDGDTPSEAGCIRSIDAAWRYLVDEQKIHPRRIVIFGRSIGSGPSVDLASRAEVEGTEFSPLDAAGVILQSPLESGAYVVLGGTAATLGYYLDIFRNYEKIGNIKAKATSLLNGLCNEFCGRRPKWRHEQTEVAIMHGTDDEVVPFSNGEEGEDRESNWDRSYEEAKGRQRFLVQPSPLSHSDGGNKKTPVDRRIQLDRCFLLLGEGLLDPEDRDLGSDAENKKFALYVETEYATGMTPPKEIIVEVGRFSTTTAAGHFSLAGTTIWARLVAVADALERGFGGVNDAEALDAPHASSDISLSASLPQSWSDVPLIEEVLRKDACCKEWQEMLVRAAEEARQHQGHHKSPSVQLYSRELRNSIRVGWFGPVNLEGKLQSGRLTSSGYRSGWSPPSAQAEQIGGVSTHPTFWPSKKGEPKQPSCVQEFKCLNGTPPRRLCDVCWGKYIVGRHICCRRSRSQPQTLSGESPQPPLKQQDQDRGAGHPKPGGTKNGTMVWGTPPEVLRNDGGRVDHEAPHQWIACLMRATDVVGSLQNTYMTKTYERTKGDMRGDEFLQQDLLRASECGQCAGGGSA